MRHAAGEVPSCLHRLVTEAHNGGRVAIVHTEDGRVVTVVGTPEQNSAATSVDRIYVVGARYRFHALNAESPYQDNACTATARLDAVPSAPTGIPAEDGTRPVGPVVLLPAVAGGATVAAVLIPLMIPPQATLTLHPSRRRWSGPPLHRP